MTFLVETSHSKGFHQHWSMIGTINYLRFHWTDHESIFYKKKKKGFSNHLVENLESFGCKVSTPWYQINQDF